MTSDIASPGSTDFERMAHYREQAAQFQQWAEEETVPEARDGLRARVIACQRQRVLRFGFEATESLHHPAQIAGRAGVPGIRNDKTAAFVEPAECGATRREI